MKKITLTNNFHNTKTVVLADVVDCETHFEVALTGPQMRRAERKLCGVAGCKCGGPAGIRGPQSFGAKRLYIAPVAALAWVMLKDRC